MNRATFTVIGAGEVSVQLCADGTVDLANRSDTSEAP